MGKHLMLLSNSTLPGQSFFQWVKQDALSFFSEHKVNEVVFIPFAAVGFSYDEYEARLNEVFSPEGIEFKGIHRFENPEEAIRNAQAIAVGGGNTFHLRRETFRFGVVDAIRQKVLDKGTPYIGWSAGSNLSCPHIFTTNDMPIVDPEGFEGLGLVPFQINPHYTAATIPNHGGESRDTRLNEFTVANPESMCLAIPEGSWLDCRGDELFYRGTGEAILFSARHPRLTFSDGDKISLS